MDRLTKFLDKIMQKPRIDKAFFRFYLFSALEREELFELSHRGFVEAFFGGGDTPVKDGELRLLGIYESDRSLCPSLVAPDGAGYDKKLGIFMRWLESDEALGFFTDRLKRTDGAIAAAKSAGHASDTLYTIRKNLVCFVRELRRIKRIEGRKRRD